MKETNVATIFETQYAKAHNNCINKYGINKPIYNVDEKDLNKRRPIVIYEMNDMKAVVFKVTSNEKTPRIFGMYWGEFPNEKGELKKSFINFIPLIVNTSEIWKHNYLTFPEEDKKKLKNTLKRYSSPKNDYYKILVDSLKLINQY